MNVSGFRPVPISECVEPIRTWNPARDSQDETFQYIDISSVSQEEKEITPNGALPVAEAPSRARQLVQSGDVLVSTVRPNLNAVALVPEEMDGATASTGFCVLRTNPKRLSERYLFHWVRTPGFVTEMVKQATGQSYPAVSDKIVKQSSLPLPSLDDQRRIVAILDQADALHSKSRQALKRLGCLTQAIFLEMFGDWSRPGHSSALVKVGDRLDFLTSGSRGWASHYRESGSLFLRIQNVRKDQLDFSDVAYVEAPNTAEAKRTRVQPGDVLFSITADLGRTAVIPDGIGTAFINQHLSILRSSAFEPRFLSAALSSQAGQRAIQGKNREGVKAGLNFDDIRSLEIPDVDRAVQRAFAEKARQVDAVKYQHLAARERFRALFASLQNRAFRGEL